MLDLPTSANVLAVGYSLHEKPFHLSERDGLPSYLLRLQTEGMAHAWVDGAMVPIRPGTLLLYNPGSAYELRIDEPRDGAAGNDVRPSFDYFLFCDGEWMDMWWKQFGRPTMAQVPLEDGLIPIWKEIIRDRKVAAFESGDSLVSEHLLKALCLVIDRLTVHIEQQAPQSNPFVAHRMKVFIEQHAAQPFKVQDVATEVGLSTSRAVHLFKATFGHTMMDYALNVRLNMACERIRYGTMSLEQAAMSSGFGSYSYFHRVFKSRFGMTPREYRVR